MFTSICVYEKAFVWDKHIKAKKKKNKKKKAAYIDELLKDIRK